MTLETLDPRHDAASDETRFSYPFTGEPNSAVIVPRSAMVHGEAFIKARTEGWFIDHPKPRPGESIRIETYQFNPRLRQPEK
jgi:hypothetical protein